MVTRPPFDPDGSFSAWLEADAYVRPSEDLLVRVLSRTEATRRRPAWLVIERWFPVSTTARFGAIPKAAMILALMGLLLAFAGAVAVGSQPSGRPLGPGGFSPGAPLQMVRAAHTATLLPDGHLLVVGGYGGIESTAELWDPATETFMRTGPLAQGRHFHTASPVSGGRVLVTGGGPDTSLASAEIWDPATGTFASAASMAQARALHAAAVLRDGRVLVAGGSGNVTSAELWDPGTDSFDSAGFLARGRGWHNAILLPDDRVLIVGGPALAELWDPTTRTFSPAGSLGEARWWATATLLEDGRVLVIGGMAGEGFDAAADAVASAELWDPTTLTFSPAGTLGEARGVHTATLLGDGRVLVVGGLGNGQARASAELWDPVTMSFSPAASMAQGRLSHTATLLPDGRVVVIGGDAGDDTALATVEVWDPNGSPVD